MKKLIAILLCTALTFSLAACTKDSQSHAATQSPTASSTTETGTSATVGTSSTTVPSTTTTTLPSFTEVTDFEDFVETLEDEGFEFTETETEDGMVIVDMETPTNPIIPVTKPTGTQTTSKATKPSTATTVTSTTATAKPTTTTTAKPTTTVRPTTSSTTAGITQTPLPSTTTTTTKPTTVAKPTATTYTYTTGQVHQALPYTERYLYSKLDDHWKECYRKIDKAVNALEDRVDLHTELSDNGGYKIFYLYLFDNPQHFYLANRVCIHSSGDNNDSLTFYYAVGNEKGEYSGYGYGPFTDELRDKVRAKKAVFDAEVQRIVSTIPANAPAVVKEKLIYDRILIDSCYNLSARWDGLAEDNWTAYGILVNKYGVCESYAEAFQTLCLAVGINCTGIVGTAGGGHKWNAVQLDGEWYQCDVTFDDPIGGEPGAAYHYYFNLTSERMTELRHDWSNSDWPVPECTAAKYQYNNYFGGDN